MFSNKNLGDLIYDFSEKRECQRVRVHLAEERKTDLNEETTITSR